MLTIEKSEMYRMTLIERLGLLGFYIYLRFLKKIVEEPEGVQMDPGTVLTETMKPILDRYHFFNERMEGYIKEGFSLRDALTKVSGDINSPGDDDLFEVFKKEKIVEDGLKGFDPEKLTLTFLQATEYYKVNQLSLIEKVNFLYNLFTRSETKRPNCKKKLERKKRKGRE